MNRSVLVLCLGAAMALTAACSRQNSVEPQAPPADTSATPPASPDSSTLPPDATTPPDGTTPGTTTPDSTTGGTGSGTTTP